jgi:hypothetical protein
VCLPLFDRAPVSRDRGCYSLAKISEILGGRQRFGMRQSFDHFEHGGPVQKQAGTVRHSTGESPPIKAGHREIPPHLETTSTQFNTSARSMRISAGPERSQLLRILPSITVRQFFSVSAYFFLLRQHWRTPNFFHAPMFLHASRFEHAPRFWMRQCCAKVFGCPSAPMFLYAPRFLYIFLAPIFVCILPAFLFSMRQ